MANLFRRITRHRLTKAANVELRRFIVTRLGREQVIPIDKLGEHRFRCRESMEIGRTVDYGYELSSLAAFVFLLGPDDVVWDVGASVGLFSVHCAAKAREVLAFEPDPPTRKRLEENARLNGLAGKIRVQPYALGESPGELELFSDGLAGSAPVIANTGRHKHSVKVPVETVDRLIAQGLPPPTALKVDIEGAEILALRGARGLLHSAQAPRLIFVEIHPQFLPSFGSTPDEVTRLVREAGYLEIAAHDRFDQSHIVAVKITR